MEHWLDYHFNPFCLSRLSEAKLLDLLIPAALRWVQLGFPSAAHGVPTSPLLSASHKKVAPSSCKY